MFDASLAFLRRLGRGENVFRAHRPHLYRRLVIAGHSHCLVSLLSIGLAGYGLGLAALGLHGGAWADLAMIVGLAAGACGLWVLVRLAERGHERVMQVLADAGASESAGCVP